MIVVVFIPIVFRAPAVSVFIPPAMAVLPAESAGFGKLVAPVVGFWTLPAVFCDGFMKFVVGMNGAFLAVLGAQVGRTCKQQNTREQRGGQYKT